MHLEELKLLASNADNLDQLENISKQMEEKTGEGNPQGLIERLSDLIKSLLYQE